MEQDVPKELLESCRHCWNSLYMLHGYLEALPPHVTENDLSLFFLADSKYSFDLDDFPVSFSRLFEAYSTDHSRQDKIPDMIFRFVDWFAETRFPVLEDLKPVYINTSKKNADLWREKNTASVKSYHTNLTLYTAPDNSSVIRELRKNLNQEFGRHPKTDPLLHMARCHYQIRALAPFTDLSHHTARTYTQLWIRRLGLNFHFLPIARIISTKRETYQSIMRDMAAGKTYDSWSLFIVDVLHDAARYLLDKIRELQALRKTTRDILEKYTAYHLPAAELMPVMFSRPFIKPRYIIEQLACHRHTAYAYLDHLVLAGLLIEKKAGREKLYLHKALFDVLSN